MSFEILNDADIYFGYGLSTGELPWGDKNVFAGYKTGFCPGTEGFDGTISPVSTLLNAVSGIGDDECLRQASINAGIGAGVLKPDGVRELEIAIANDNINKTESENAYFESDIFHWVASGIPNAHFNDVSGISNFESNYSALLQTSVSCSELVDYSDIQKLFPDSEQNPPRFPGDMYTPRWIRGVGKNKEGICPICHANGVLNWRRMKCSAYWYHLNYFHGVSSLTGRPFPEPAATRIVRKSTERGSRQGLCNVCNSWVDIDSSRKVQINVPEIYWWKHIQACIKRTWKAE